MTARRKLVREDRQTYLERWGIEDDRFGGVFVHHLTAADPGKDPHDHPWVFASIVVRGSYVEARSSMRTDVERWQKRERWSIRKMRLDEMHRIVHVNGDCWTVVVHGPRVRNWGYRVVGKWISHDRYDSMRRRLTDAV